MVFEEEAAFNAGFIFWGLIDFFVEEVLMWLDVVSERDFNCIGGRFHFRFLGLSDRNRLLHDFRV